MLLVSAFPAVRHWLLCFLGFTASAAEAMLHAPESWHPPSQRHRRTTNPGWRAGVMVHSGNEQLAPTDALGFDDEQVHALGEEFVVSAQVIEHQIDNHRLHWR